MEVEATIVDTFAKRSKDLTSNCRVEYGDEILSNSAFWETAAGKAFHLQNIFSQELQRPLLPGDCIALSSRRSLETLSDMVAILLSKAAFVPFDPRDPSEKISYILKDTAVRGILEGGTLSLQQDARAPIVLSKERPTANAWEPLAVASSDLAYVMYTSGSTGRPKGVRISHRALWHYSQWFGSFDFHRALTRFDFSTHLTFDFAITTSLVALAHGKTVVVCPEEVKQSPRAFLEYLTVRKIQLCKSTPSFFKLLVQEAAHSHVRVPHKMTWLLGGEEMNPTDCAAWMELHPEHDFYNAYGPTEATVSCSKFRIDRNNIRFHRERVPIEKDSRVCRFHVVNEQMLPVPDGEKGELCIEGPILADGYQNRPDETRAVFVERTQGEIWYRTGDQVMRFPDGTIHYFGRKDNQVKIRGVRIELDEIRHVICSMSGVADAAVLSVRRNDLPLLVAFVVPETKQISDSEFADNVEAYLLKRLSANMTPQNILVLERLPLSHSGKIDVSALHGIASRHSIRTAKMVVSSPLELSLIKIWKDLLPEKRMGTDSNFFQLGGNSLVAMQVMDRVNRLLGTRLPPDLIFQRPNIRQLAQAICDRNLDIHLHHFQNCPESPALFLVHPATGMAHLYQELQTELKGVDFYGISHDRFGETSHRYPDLETMAKAYVDILLKKRSRGPYVVGGFCTGGAVAFEMARILSERNVAPQGVVLIDSFNLQRSGTVAERARYNRVQLELKGIDEESFFGRALVSELDYHRDLVIRHKPKYYAGHLLMFQCDSFDTQDFDTRPFEELSTQLNGWMPFLEVARVKRVTIETSHRRLFNDRTLIVQIGGGIARFIRETGMAC